MCDVMISCLLSITENLFIFILKILCKWGWLGEHSLSHRPITWWCNSLQELWKLSQNYLFQCWDERCHWCYLDLSFWDIFEHKYVSFTQDVVWFPGGKNSSTMWRYHPLVMCWTSFALHWNEVGAVIQLLSLVWGEGITKQTGRGKFLKSLELLYQ